MTRGLGVRLLLVLSVFALATSPTTPRVAIGTRLNGAWLTDTTFANPQQIESGRWNTFVAFIPEPSAGGLVVQALLLVGFTRRLGAARKAL